MSDVETASSAVETDAAGIVQLERRGRVAVLTMRHKPHNLLGSELIGALTRAFAQTDWAGIGAVVLRSGARHFCAGGDLAMFEQRVDTGDPACIPPMLPFMETMERFPLPIVAAVHGACLGGGLELAMMCDFIIAARSAKIGAVEAALGLHPLMGGVQRMVQRCGALRAKELAMLARRYDAETLERWNLVNLVVPDDRLDATALVIASELAHGPTKAHEATKILARIAVNEGVAAADAAMEATQAPIWASQDLRIGLAAFREGGPGSAIFTGH